MSMSVMMKIGMANEQAKALRGNSDEDDATDCDLPAAHEDNDELELASQGSLIVSLRPRASIALSSSSSDDDEDDADEYDAGVPPTGLHAPVASTPGKRKRGTVVTPAGAAHRVQARMGQKEPGDFSSSAIELVLVSDSPDSNGDSDLDDDVVLVAFNAADSAAPQPRGATGAPAPGNHDNGIDGASAKKPGLAAGASRRRSKQRRTEVQNGAAAAAARYSGAAPACPSSFQDPGGCRGGLEPACSDVGGTSVEEAKADDQHLSSQAPGSIHDEAGAAVSIAALERRIAEATADIEAAEIGQATRSVIKRLTQARQQLEAELADMIASSTTSTPEASATRATSDPEGHSSAEERQARRPKRCKIGVPTDVTIRASEVRNDNTRYYSAKLKWAGGQTDGYEWFAASYLSNLDAKVQDAGHEQRFILRAMQRFDMQDDLSSDSGSDDDTAPTGKSKRAVAHITRELLQEDGTRLLLSRLIPEELTFFCRVCELLGGKKTNDEAEQSKLQAELAGMIGETSRWGARRILLSLDGLLSAAGTVEASTGARGGKKKKYDTGLGVVCQDSAEEAKIKFISGATLFCVACRWGHVGLCVAIVERADQLGISKDVLSPPGASHAKQEDTHRFSPLEYAIAGGHLRVVQYLRSKGTSFDQLGGSREETIIVACVRDKQLKLLEMLLDRPFSGKAANFGNADTFGVHPDMVNRPDKNGWGPAFWLVDSKYPNGQAKPVLSLWIRAGGDVCAQDDNGDNVLLWGLSEAEANGTSDKVGDDTKFDSEFLRELAAQSQFVKPHEPRLEIVKKTFNPEKHKDNLRDVLRLLSKKTLPEYLGKTDKANLRSVYSDVLAELLYGACSNSDSFFFDVLDEFEEDEKNTLLKSMRPACPLAHHGQGTAIHAAANLEDDSIMKRLKEQQDISGKAFDWNVVDMDGETPLIVAAQAGNLPAVKFLLEQGANPNVQAANGSTAAIAAVGTDKVRATKIIEVLVEAGADLSLPDENGWTVLHWATDLRHASDSTADTVGVILKWIKESKKEVAEGLLLAQDNISKSNVLHQLCNYPVGDSDGDPETIKTALTTLIKVVSSLVKCTAEFHDEGSKAKQSLCRNMLGQNKFGNTPLHLLFAHLPCYPESEYFVGRGVKQWKAMYHAARELIKLVIAACDSDRATPRCWATELYALKNELKLMPLEVLSAACGRNKEMFESLKERVHGPMLKRLGGLGELLSECKFKEPIMNTSSDTRAATKVVHYDHSTVIGTVSLSIPGATWMRSSEEGESSYGSCGCLKVDPSKTSTHHDFDVHGMPPQYNVNGTLRGEILHQCNEIMNGDTGEDKTVILVECSSGCQCGDECANKVVSKSVMVDEAGQLQCKVQIPIYIKPSCKGQGVYCTDEVPLGTFVMAYCGKIELSRNHKSDSTYIFELPLAWEAGHTHKLLVDAIDDETAGARFLNHSCDPNLVNILVYSDDWAVRIDPGTIDISEFAGRETHRVPLICFFARKNIPKGTELTFNYGYKPGTMPGRTLFCLCGQCEPGALLT